MDTFVGVPINLKEIKCFVLFFCHNHLFNQILFLPAFLMGTLSTCKYFEDAKHFFPMVVLGCNLRVHPDFVGIKIPNSTISFPVVPFYTDDTSAIVTAESQH